MDKPLPHWVSPTLRDQGHRGRGAAEVQVFAHLHGERLGNVGNTWENVGKNVGTCGKKHEKW